MTTSAYRCQADPRCRKLRKYRRFNFRMDRLETRFRESRVTRVDSKDFKGYRAIHPVGATYNRSNAKGGIGQGVIDVQVTTNNKIKAERIHRIVAMLLELDEVTLDRMEEALKNHVTDGATAGVVVRDRP
jgi:hypothetical protein